MTCFRLAWTFLLLVLPHGGAHISTNIVKGYLTTMELICDSTQFHDLPILFQDHFRILNWPNSTPFLPICWSSQVWKVVPTFVLQSWWYGCILVLYVIEWHPRVVLKILWLECVMCTQRVELPMSVVSLSHGSSPSYDVSVLPRSVLQSSRVGYQGGRGLLRDCQWSEKLPKMKTSSSTSCVHFFDCHPFLFIFALQHEMFYYCQLPW